MYRSFFFVFSVFLALLLWLAPGRAVARDVRLALLVANERGWKGDPQLSYVIRGDLHPLARALRQLGFEVRVLPNKDAAHLRQAFTQIKKRLSQTPHVTTFLFYYSGHADQRHLHLGPKKSRPMSYREVARFFSVLKVTRRIAIFDSCYSGEVIRQFGSLSRYRKLLKKGKPKGVRSRRPVDLSKLVLPQQGKEEGLRIISSSLDLSWEVRRYRASVFTHHLLRGLRGAADLDRDGKISIDELFDFASREVTQETGQKPQQLVLVQRRTPYALAPAYRSRLWIGPNVVGRLRISVANFVWTQHKRRRRSLRLAIVDGKGQVQLQRKTRCWRQDILLPKGGEARLSRQWKPVPCRQSQKVAKGTVFLPVRVYYPPPLKVPGSLSLWSGYSRWGAAPVSASHLTLGLNFRWGIAGAGFSFTSGAPANKQFRLSRFLLRAEIGYPLDLYTKGFSWIFFSGVYLHGGLTLQHAEEVDAVVAPSVGGGATADFTWWLTRRLGLRLGAQAGVDYTPVLNTVGISFHWEVKLSVLFGL